jgi:PAS domain S-box-containing protein
VEVDVPGGESLTNLVNSLVRVRGVCASRANLIRQLVGAYVWSPSTNLVLIEEKAIADPFVLPAQTIASLSEFNQRRATQHQVKIVGVVTFNDSGFLFVQDDSGGVPVYLTQVANFKPGDRVEVAGYVSPGDFGYVFRNASCRLLGHASIPAPKMVFPVGVLNQNLHGSWVQLDARLVSSSRRDNDYVMTLQAESSIFEAIRPGTTNSQAADWLPRAGSLVRLHGVYAILGDDSRMPRAFRLYVPDTAAIATLERASWWTFQRTMVTVAIMGIVILASVLWVITLRRRIRQQTATLQQSELKFRSLVEQSLVGVYIIQNERFVYVNPRLAQICGYDAAEMIQSLPVGDTIFEADRPMVQEQIRRRDSGEIATTHTHCRVRRKDGAVIFVEALGNRTLYDGAPAIVGTLLDITERKRAEAALAEASTLLEALLDSSPDHIYFKDRQSRFVRYSQSFVELLHLSDPGSLKGKTDFDIFSEEHARPAYDDEQQIMRTGQPVVGKLERETHKDGSISWALTTKLPWRDKDGNIIGTFGTSKDVTAIKEVEEKLAREREFFHVLADTLPDNIYFKDRESRFVRVSHSKLKSTMPHALHRYRQQHPGAPPDDLPAYLTSEEAFADYLVGKTDFDFYGEKLAREAFEQEQNIIHTGIPIIGKLGSVTAPDGIIRWLLVTKMPWHDKEGNIIGTFGISKDITALKEAEEKLTRERELFHALVDNLPDAIYFKDSESRFVRLSRSKVERSRQVLLERHREENPKLDTSSLPIYLVDTEKCAEFLAGKTDFDVYPEDRARTAYADEQQIISSGQPIIGKLEQSHLIDGKTLWYLTTKMPWRDHNGKIIGTFGVSREITALKDAEAKLEAAHRRIVETSRLAGMAEVATDVLHNVGNVLNSVNVACSLSIDRIKSSRISSLSKVSALLRENSDRLTEFFSHDPRLQQLPDYVAVLAEHLESEQATLSKELEQLLKHIDHIKQIVAMQQSYAKVAGVMEEVNATQLVEDALQINGAALTRHDVHVRREFQVTAPITTEKHKVLQILVNLIRNAKYAMDEARCEDKLLTVKVTPASSGSVKIQVMDNGIGIPQENLTRIFAHGFTTRRDGHGFGLHSSALAVRELGGSLQAHSDGPGAGATFTLLLPHQPPVNTQKTV